ncbi:MAG: DUF1295 domain-containing protein [Saprospiraceae bacterium]|nr:DUF1295 domain-containing protein [Saprospiraceae bacterium]
MEKILILSLLVITAINVAAYIWAYLKQSDHLTDISYSLCFIGLSGWLLLQYGPLSSGRVVLFLMVALWGIRLGGFLFYRIQTMGRDYRFDSFRSSWSGFLKFWLLQSVSIWIIALPVIAGLYIDNLGFNPIGLIVWAAGWILETVADYQKFTFKSKPDNKDKFISSGLYSHIRHPNYTGEILVWLGIFLYVTPALSGWWWLVALSPLWIVVLLVFISGIPLLDANAESKYGHLPEYRSYRKKSSYLIPWIY